MRIRNRFVSSSQSQSPLRYDSAIDNVPPKNARRNSRGWFTRSVARKSPGSPREQTPYESCKVISPRSSPDSCRTTMRLATRSKKPGDATSEHSTASAIVMTTPPEFANFHELSKSRTVLTFDSRGRTPACCPPRIADAERTARA